MQFQGHFNSFDPIHGLTYDFNIILYSQVGADAQTDHFVIIHDQYFNHLHSSAF
ncbi:hypothetical protein FC91_GL001467 [Schleiferilactobacillus harbinensis DSM 16991]|uniref:Uncharacterized protein n=1 Tax=Schleiferilactobacillus harbinensis DSM 16991 TaxID=1122147 RepID=A0A0R1X1B5_9LACO|nr:hypothetical protein FC91_GL001467 [Schleiferilactobacillus harbinensis DSM 16991]